MLTQSNARGYAILALLFDTLNDDELAAMYVEPYLNGRESGFAVGFRGYFRAERKLADVKLVFSNERRSDQAVVYKSDSCGFSMQGNGLTDKIYLEGSRCFNNVLAAAEYVVAELRQSAPVAADDTVPAIPDLVRSLRVL